MERFVVLNENLYSLKHQHAPTLDLPIVQQVNQVGMKAYEVSLVPKIGYDNRHVLVLAKNPRALQEHLVAERSKKFRIVYNIA